MYKRRIVSFFEILRLLLDALGVAQDEYGDWIPSSFEIPAGCDKAADGTEEKSGKRQKSEKPCNR